MIYSLNEIDSHCKKAARGAGMAWGYAEEIGKAARWLAAFKLPGVNLLCSFLIQTEHEKLKPPIIESQNHIHADHDILCPIHTGSYIADTFVGSSNQEYSFKRLGFPLLLLPFLARLADQAKLSISYQYHDNLFNYADGKLKSNVNGTLICDYVKYADGIFTAQPVNGENARVTGQEIDTADWNFLNSYAHKTYVPATEQSRRGAGPSE